MVDLPMVYAIITDNFEYIKIGHTKNFKQRLNNLQSGCPFKLSLWLIIRTQNPRQIESTLHEELRHCCVRGEWFSPDEEDLDFIADFFKQENLVTRAQINALLPI